MLKRVLGDIGYLALAALVAWALAKVTTNVAQAMGLGAALILLLGFVISWIALKRSR